MGSWVLFLEPFWCVYPCRIRGSNNTIHTHAVWQLCVWEPEIGKLWIVQAADSFCIIPWHVKKKKKLLENDLTKHSLTWALQKREACLMHCVLALSVQVYEGCRGYSWCWIIFTSVYPDPHTLLKLQSNKFWQKAAMSCCAGLSWCLGSPYPYWCSVSRYFLSLCGTGSSSLSVLKFLYLYFTDMQATGREQ